MEGYELKDLKLRRRGEALNDIPDFVYAKRFVPLTEKFFTAIRLMDNWKSYRRRLDNI